jgi:aquaglyceroporin related protein, other eukaryote
MAGPVSSSSQENIDQASPMEKDHKLHQTNSDSTDFRETIATLPTSEAQQTTTSFQPQKTSSNLYNTRGKLGLHPTAPVIEEHDAAEHSDLWWSKVRMSLKEPFAEFFGVFFMVLFGDGSVAQVLLSTGQQTAPGGDGFGNYQSINWCWGIGVMLGIYIAGDSGAYLKYVEQIHKAQCKG